MMDLALVDVARKASVTVAGNNTLLVMSVVADYGQANH